MRREVRLRLLCASLLTTNCACGQITHDIGQIKAVDRNGDGSTVSSTVSASDADSRRDVTTGYTVETGTPELDSSYDGSRFDVETAKDAAPPYQAEDGEIDSQDALDATVDECFEESIEI